MSLSRQNPEQGMKEPRRPQRDYPHMISRGPGGNLRWPISISNVRRTGTDAYKYVGRDYVGVDSGPTMAGRSAILQGISEGMGRTGHGRCVVWSATSCTYLLPDGTTREGRRPPTGTLVADDYEPDLPPLRVEDVWTLRLPPGCLRSHLCLKRRGDLVEIGGGEAMVVADLIDCPLPGLPDPFALRRADDGSWLLPFVHRGVQVTAVRNGAVLLGPVQMVRDDALRIMHDPWPAEVEEACQDLAGRALPRVMLDAAWRAIDPADPEMNHVGVLEAA